MNTSCFTKEAWSTRWRIWLRDCATSWKVAGSIHFGVFRIFNWLNLSGRTMALGLTQPLTWMTTGNISWGVKAAGAWSWQPYHLHLPIVLKSGSFILLELSRPVQACNGIALSLLLFYGRSIKVKVKCTLVQALRLHTGPRRGEGWGVSVTPRPLFTPGKDPVPIVQEAGWAPGPVWTGTENLAPTGIRSPDRPARSQLLYRLSYRAHTDETWPPIKWSH